MFVENDATLLTQLSKQHSLDAFGLRFIETYIKLPESQREIIKNFAYMVVGEKDVRSTADELPPANIKHELTAADQAEIDAECEKYRRELEEEAFPERFTTGTNSSQKNA